MTTHTLGRNLFASATLALALAPLAAQAQMPYNARPPMRYNYFAGPYLSMNLGFNETSDLVVPSFGSLSLDTGLHFDLAWGVAFPLAPGLSFAPELEVGVLYNNVNAVTAYGVGTLPARGSLTQVPFFLNSVLHFQLAPALVAYAGVGAGGDRLSLSDASNTSIGSETNFAWQAMAGVRYQIGAIMLGIGYKHVETTPKDLETLNNDSVFVSYALHFQ